jgi:single-stranded DNA-binding protein
MGTKMNIIVDKIKGDKVYVTATLGGRTWENRMTRYYSRR